MFLFWTALQPSNRASHAANVGWTQKHQCCYKLKTSSSYSSCIQLSYFSMVCRWAKKSKLAKFGRKRQANVACQRANAGLANRNGLPFQHNHQNKSRRARKRRKDEIVANKWCLGYTAIRCKAQVAKRLTLRAGVCSKSLTSFPSGCKHTLVFAEAPETPVSLRPEIRPAGNLTSPLSLESVFVLWC